MIKITSFLLLFFVVVQVHAVNEQAVEDSMQSCMPVATFAETLAKDLKKRSVKKVINKHAKKMAKKQNISIQAAMGSVKAAVDPITKLSEFTPSGVFAYMYLQCNLEKNDASSPQLMKLVHKATLHCQKTIKDGSKMIGCISENLEI